MVDILRQPDRVMLEAGSEDNRFEEAQSCVSGIVELKISRTSAQIIVNPVNGGLRFIKLRWNGDLSKACLALKDGWERAADLGWHVPQPEALYPWFTAVYDGERTFGWGVRTRPDAFCGWQLDRFGVSLWIDLRNGNGASEFKAPLTACTVTQATSLAGENAWAFARRFARELCPDPVLPASPVFGVNDWYWAYGRNSIETVIKTADELASVSEGLNVKPYCVIDDGWQVARFHGASGNYNGGPWNITNQFFPGGTMKQAADEIKQRGARPGIWFRPLLTIERLPQDAELRRPGDKTTGILLDASHPYTLEKVETDARRLAEWGFRLLKHDFTLDDSLGKNLTDYKGAQWRFYDTSKTNAQILKNLYAAVQRGAGTSEVIGCNTCGHLAAGIHALQRTGNDTSGRVFEWTRRNGVNALIRSYQNDIFFKCDPDCAAFTDKVPHELNFDFLEACALTGSAVLASVAPGCLDTAELDRLCGIFRMAAEFSGEPAEPADWMRVSTPSEFIRCGHSHVYDWYSYTAGARLQLTWLG